MKICHLATLSLALLAAFGSNTAHADTNLLADGDFENFAAQVPNGGFITVATGPMGAWTVSGPSVDLIRHAYYGSIADVSVDLGGTPGPGAISQTFQAIAGTTYTLSWDYFRNGDGTQLDVSFGGGTTSYAPPADITHTSLTWTATTSGLQTVSFGTANPGNQGPTLDNVTLFAAPVPEPSSAAVLLAGLGCMGWLLRRRRS